MVERFILKSITEFAFFCYKFQHFLLFSLRLSAKKLCELCGKKIDLTAENAKVTQRSAERIKKPAARQ
jgi:hypothetical protein